MKTWLSISLACLCSFRVQAQEYNAEVKKAEMYYDKKDYDSCDLLFTKAFQIQPPDGRDLYNAVVCAALKGAPDNALDYLCRAIRLGANISKLKIDPAFDKLHQLTGWKNLIKNADKIQNDTFNKYPYPVQAAKLAKLWEEDQYYRFRLAGAYRDKDTVLANDLWKKMRVADSLVLQKLLPVIQEIGWPTRSKVGPHGATTAFLIIDHAPREVMESYLPYLETAAKMGEAPLSQFATLKDRVLVNRGKKQIYGTQKYWDPQQGKFIYFEIEDKENVNKLRREVGLEPLPEFKQ